VAEFWRVKPGRYPFRNAEVRVQLREKTRFGSVLLDEFNVWVDDVEPAVAVERAKRVIRTRRAQEDAVRAVLGDSPVKGEL
jgi:RNase P/RNase MRP subunit POP5